jgi:N-acetyl-alpha-D-glucosaminyl L-malate synthase BshA
MKIGMVCYASVGGSGVVATELAHALGERGHEVTLISSELPFRWRPDVPGLTFEQVTVPAYPLFREPQYLLALANTLARVSEERQLDIVHAHYAVPHATAAYLADQMVLSARGRRPRTMTTLHGTDITLVGSDPSYARVVRFSIEQSDAVTAVSESLKQDTLRALGSSRAIQVIANFLDCAEYRRREDAALRRRLCPSPCDVLVIHVSNFRPVKRVDVAMEVFARVRRRVPARFVLLGDGPVRAAVEQQARDAGIAQDVTFLGEQHDLVPYLSAADVFLLPSAQESFGLAALEAMACEVPVVASRVGGLPEIIEDGVTGFICDPDAIDEMADRTAMLLTDGSRRQQMGRAAADVVRTLYCTDRIVPQYEDAYEALLAP